MSQPAYPQALPIAAVAERLARAVSHAAHTFLPDDYSMLDIDQLNWKNLMGHRQVTDSYLLGLAVRHQCRFVTFDTRINPYIVVGAQPEHWVSIG